MRRAGTTGRPESVQGGAQVTMKQVTMKEDPDSQSGPASLAVFRCRNPIPVRRRVRRSLGEDGNLGEGGCIF